jgi:hypothetical protein
MRRAIENQSCKRSTRRPLRHPTGLAGTATTATNINLTWTACADTSGSLIAGYKIYRGGTQIGTSTTLSYSDDTVVGNNTYSYTVAVTLLRE